MSRRACVPPVDLEVIEVPPLAHKGTRRAPWVHRLNYRPEPLVFVTGMRYQNLAGTTCTGAMEHGADYAAAMQEIKALLWDAPHATAWISRFEYSVAMATRLDGAGDEVPEDEDDDVLLDPADSLVEVRFFRLDVASRARAVVHCRAEIDARLLAANGITPTTLPTASDLWDLEVSRKLAAEWIVTLST